MYIKRLRTKHFSPFRDRGVTLDITPAKTINILRGENGAGKTSIAEIISLIGHVCCIPDKNINVLDESETLENFFDSTHNGSQKISKAFFTVELNDVEINYLSDAKSSGKIIFQNLKNEISFILYSKFELVKDIIGDDISISERLLIAVKHKNDADALILINSFNRPQQAPNEDIFYSEKCRDDFLEHLASSVRDVDLRSQIKSLINNQTSYSQTERIGYLKKNCLNGIKWSNISRIPGLVTYINTDLYERGIGCDLRESPKNLSSELSEVIDDRFHLFLPTINPLEKTLIFKDEINKYWKEIIANDSIIETISLEESASKGIRGKIIIKHTGKNNNGRVREFLSSGENQVLFFLIMLVSLSAKDSIIIADEPELHLGFEIKRNFFDWLINFCITNNNQIFIVTHESLTLKYNLENTANSDTNLFYLSLSNDEKSLFVGYEAFKKIGISSRSDLEFIRGQLSEPYTELASLKPLEFIKSLISLK